jgi:hypothetical protein
MFRERVGGKKLSHRRKFAVVMQADSSKYDEFRPLIVEAFWILGGIRGIMSVTGLGGTQAYVLAGKFGLIRERIAKRNNEAHAKRQAENLKHLESVWGWKPGDTSVTLTKCHQYTATEKFMAGKMAFGKGEVFLEYMMPCGKVREYLISHGVKYWIAGDRHIPVEKVNGRCGHLSQKL